MGNATGKPAVKFDQKSLAAIPANGVTRSYSDPTTPGLWLRITATGVKTWYFVYRMGGRGTKLNWLKVGGFPALPLIRARELAREYRSEVDQGLDPAKARSEAARRGQTVADVARMFLEDYAPANLKEKSRKDYADSIRVHILPKLGKIPIRDLSREDVARWHTSLVGRNGKGSVAANRALAILSSICTQAEVWGVRKVQESGNNPCRHVDRFQEAPRVRDIRPKELAAIGRALTALEGVCNPWALAAVRVVALCAGRVSEVLGLRRDGGDVHLDLGYAIIREHKTSRRAGSKYLELPPSAVDILRALPEEKGNPWYFPGRFEGSHLTRNGLYRTWQTVCAEAGITDLHLHDFRSFAASEGLAQGVSSKVTSRILGHGDQRTTERHYLKVRDRQAAEASATISATIAEAFGLAITGDPKLP